MVEHNLVGDHVSEQSDKIEDKASGMVSDQAVMALSSPHEGCRDASRPPAIVGLMRNSLSEAPILIVSFMVSTIGILSESDARHGVPAPLRCTPVLLFSCQKDLRGTEYQRHYARTPVLMSKDPARHGVPAPLRCTPVLLFSCQKDLRGTECLRYYVRAIIFVFFVTKIGVASLIIKRQ